MSSYHVCALVRALICALVRDLTCAPRSTYLLICVPGAAHRVQTQDRSRLLRLPPLSLYTYIRMAGRSEKKKSFI